MAGRAAAKRDFDQPIAGRPCATHGCEGLALAYGPKCEGCTTRDRQEKSAARCAELGLVSIEDKREFCRRMARSFGTGPTFEGWAKNITQKAVDLIALHGNPGDLVCLDRLRAVGAIDGANKVLPLEARAIAAEAFRQETARQLVRVQTELAEQRERMERDLAERGEVRA